MFGIFKSRRTGVRRGKSKRNNKGSTPHGPVKMKMGNSNLKNDTPAQKRLDFFKKEAEQAKLENKQTSDQEFEFEIKEGKAEEVDKKATTEEIYGATLKRKKKRPQRKTRSKGRPSKASSRRPSQGKDISIVINPRRTYTTEIEPLTEEDIVNIGQSPGRSPDFRAIKKKTTRVTEIENGVEIVSTGRASKVSSANNSFLSKPRVLKKPSSQVSMGKTLWDGENNLERTIQNVLGYSVSRDVDDDGDTIPPAHVTEIENSGGKKKSVQQRRKNRKPKFVDNDNKKKGNSKLDV